MAGRAPLFLAQILGLLSPTSGFAEATPATATVTITDDGTGSALAPRSLGLSFNTAITRLMTD
jgi:hypothetical protein